MFLIQLLHEIDWYKSSAGNSNWISKWYCYKQTSSLFTRLCLINIAIVYKMDVGIRSASSACYLWPLKTDCDIMQVAEMPKWATWVTCKRNYNLRQVIFLLWVKFQQVRSIRNGSVFIGKQRGWQIVKYCLNRNVINTESNSRMAPTIFFMIPLKIAQV